MSVKLALLKSGDTVIADVKELVSDENICGYLFKEPYIVRIQPKLLIEGLETDENSSTEVLFSPWIPLTSDTEIVVRPDWLVTIVEPHNEITELYGGRTNGQSDQGNTLINE